MHTHPFCRTEACDPTDSLSESFPVKTVNSRKIPKVKNRAPVENFKVAGLLFGEMALIGLAFMYWQDVTVSCKVGAS